MLYWALGLAVFYAISVTLYYSGSKSSTSSSGLGPRTTMSEAPPVLSAPPMEASASTPSASASPKPVRRNVEDLVRSLIGIWKGEDGVRVYIDPPRPRLGSRAPYHFTVETPKGGGTYGCDFTDSERVKKLDESEWHGRAWCGGPWKGKKAFVGITVSDGKLSVTLQVDGVWILTALDMIQIGGGHLPPTTPTPSSSSGLSAPAASGDPK